MLTAIHNALSYGKLSASAWLKLSLSLLLTLGLSRAPA